MKKILFIMLAIIIVVVSTAVFAQVATLGEKQVSTTEPFYVYENPEVDSNVTETLKQGDIVNVKNYSSDGLFAEIDQPVSGWVITIGLTELAVQPTLAPTLAPVLPEVTLAPMAAPEATPVADGFPILLNAVDLPANDAPGLSYIEPNQDGPNNCRANPNDMNEPCSSNERQLMFGPLQLPPLPRALPEGLRDVAAKLQVATGDNLEQRWTPPSGYTGPLFQNPDGEYVVFPDLEEYTGTKVVVFVTVNNSDRALDLVYLGPTGSFRGYYNLNRTIPSFTLDMMAHTGYQHVRKMMVENQPALEAWLTAEQTEHLPEEGATNSPYPIINTANCRAVKDLDENQVTFCEMVNLHVQEWNGTQWVYHYAGGVGINRDTGELQYLDLTPFLADFAVGGALAG